MVCPECQTKLKCIDSRPYPGNIRIRKYRCPECGFKETTSEEMPVQVKQEKKQPGAIFI